MKAMKYLFALAGALCATVGASNAQTVAIGGGSSALALEIGQAAVVYEDSLTGPNTACVWSRTTGHLNGGSTMNAKDDRAGVNKTESGNVWVVWGKGGVGGTCAAPVAPYNVYMYTNIDSVLGQRGFFATNAAGVSGFLQNLTLVAADSNPAVPDNILNVNPTAGHTFTDTAGGIPAVVIALLNGSRWNFAGTDIRPEDGVYATFRAETTCNTYIARQPFDNIVRSTLGLGYADGSFVQDDFGASKKFNVFNYAISGNDPYSAKPVPNYTVGVVGAQPIIVAVGPYTSGTNTGVYLAKDIPSYVAAQFFSGVSGRATDLIGPTAPWPVSALVREPLSGTYNTFEYSVINTSKYHTSMDLNNCTGAGAINPMHNLSMNGAQAGPPLYSYRRRVIGTGQMVTQLGNATESDERIGFFFWSAANVGAGSGAANIKYLTLDGVDPLQNAYTTGDLPGSGSPNDPCAGSIINPAPACQPNPAPLTSIVSFAGLNSGDYAAWSALRLVWDPGNAGVNTLLTNLIANAQVLNATQYDFVPLSRLNVWRTHYYMNAININTAANGPNIAGGNDLCNSVAPVLAEQGGDAGGAIVLKKVNSDFCKDYNNPGGLVNVTE